ncbi:hypothetical protein ACFY1P_00775 [Streptomyces sp. NPDC001407]|uniref:hypothetical protein n=1 Tax=Streptomyces sp. NPDC001407 TaxID=3364573 RepID=UPI003695830D
MRDASSGTIRFGSAFIVVVGITVVALGAVNSAHASGLLGTHGTFTVRRCETSKTSRGGTSTDCFGSFRSADGKAVKDNAELDVAYATGKQIRASCGFPDMCYKLDATDAIGWFAGLLAALTALCFAGPQLVHGAAWRGEGHRRGRAVQNRLLKSLFWSAVGSGAIAVACAVAT